MRRLSAIVRQRCPRCLRGVVFTGVMTTLERCSDCGLRFEREPGYFTAAMVISYALALPVYALFVLPGWLLWRSVELAFAVGLVPLLLAAPQIVRYSRTLWLHFDRAVDREE